MTLQLGTETGSLINHVISGQAAIKPEVGMGATILWWSDREPATIVVVEKDGKRVGIQSDNATRTDKNGLSDCQSYDYSPNPEAPVVFYTLRRNGTYVQEGQSIKGGQRIAIGRREKYRDFSF